MRQLIAILMVGSLVLTTAAKADDVDDVKATQLAVVAALNAGDAEAYTKHLLPEATGFFTSDGLLTEPWRGELLQSKFDAGLKIDIQLRHLQVKLCDNTAVVTGYETGVIIFPDGTTLKGPRRISTVWIKQAGQWKQAHIHISFITVPHD
ncbi:MAG: nuclear transport factor 2 family protein [Bacteroidetes bacterium]|nr:nuclear transport factor 2 family protein [Bacteroidota bacterium]